MQYMEYLITHISFNNAANLNIATSYIFELISQTISIRPTTEM